MTRRDGTWCVLVMRGDWRLWWGRRETELVDREWTQLPEVERDRGRSRWGKQKAGDRGGGGSEIDGKFR